MDVTIFMTHTQNESYYNVTDDDPLWDLSSLSFLTAPKYFPLAYSLIKPFLAEETAAKIFVYSICKCTLYIYKEFRSPLFYPSYGKRGMCSLSLKTPEKKFDC